VPCWIELGTNDAERGRAFYTELFGWTAGESSPEFGGYFMYFLDGAPVAGAMPLPGEPRLPDGWGTYLTVGDVAKTVEVAQRAGATVRVEQMQVADLGSSAVLDDPSGARIGAWQPGTFSGVAAIGRPGAPAWFELLSTDYERSVAFYRDVFGWDAHTAGDTPDFRYTTLGAGDEQRAGIMDAAGFTGEPAVGQWSVYFATDDADASVAKVSELGGSVVRAAEDTPYGRLAVVTDPNGALFKLLGRTAAA
jgi:hypothetical protein